LHEDANLADVFGGILAFDTVNLLPSMSIEIRPKELAIFLLNVESPSHNELA
jgi:hypothetical protein